jgi:mRNA-degrading endonuclease RelE of RelBE toxin-antitoxin system
MVILETPIFTKRMTGLMSDDEYRKLQLHLITRPDAGSLIPGSGGLRKIRWSTSRKGKRGGVRFIYYWVVQKYQIIMLMAYAKNEQADLTQNQLRMLRRLVMEEFK